MEVENIEKYKRHEHKHQPIGKVLAGLLVVLVGVALLARETGVALPSWLFTWEMLVIVLGFYVGLKHMFSNPGWLVLVLLGTGFIVDDIYPDLSFEKYFWPAIIILAGIVLIFKPSRKLRGKHDMSFMTNCVAEQDHPENKLETVALFGGVKKNIISKEFRQGEVTCVFGGAELNMSKADFNGRAEIELTQIFGGTKLIIPADWEIQSEVVAILGGVEDKRPEVKESSGKILVLKGTVIFGGIDIKSY